MPPRQKRQVVEQDLLWRRSRWFLEADHAAGPERNECVPSGHRLDRVLLAGRRLDASPNELEVRRLQLGRGVVELNDATLPPVRELDRHPVVLQPRSFGRGGRLGGESAGRSGAGDPAALGGFTRFCASPNAVADRSAAATSAISGKCILMPALRNTSNRRSGVLPLLFWGLLVHVETDDRRRQETQRDQSTRESGHPQQTVSPAQTGVEQNSSA